MVVPEELFAVVVDQEEGEAGEVGVQVVCVDADAPTQRVWDDLAVGAG